NQGQRVNVAHSIQVQPPSVAPSVIFDYIDHLDQNQKYVLSPIAKGMVLDHHNILVELEKARRDSGLGETLLFDIEITYEDVTRSKKFRTTVKLEYFPEEERAAGRDAFNRKITHEILKVKDTVI